jgi:hypothetical protein
MIVYYHGNKAKDWLCKDEYTICVDLPDHDVIEYMTHIGTEKSIMIPVGIAQKHSKDQYVKKIGRQLSLSRVQSKLFTLEEVRFVGDRAELCLSTEDDYRLILHLKAGSKRVYLAFALKGKDE